MLRKSGDKFIRAVSRALFMWLVLVFIYEFVLRVKVFALVFSILRVAILAQWFRP
jgi:hypothetical protein